MLEELIARYGENAVVTARPHMLESGETYRWELEIDSENVPDAAAHVRKHPERPDVMVMVLVHGEEEVEIGRRSTKRSRYGPAAVIRRLGDLR